jgi:hypothetical protein
MNTRLVNQFHTYWGLLVTRDLVETPGGTEAAPIPAIGEL